jgi:hypothetical protein
LKLIWTFERGSTVPFGVVTVDVMLVRYAAEMWKGCPVKRYVVTADSATSKCDAVSLIVVRNGSVALTPAI